MESQKVSDQEPTDSAAITGGAPAVDRDPSAVQAGDSIGVPGGIPMEPSSEAIRRLESELDDTKEKYLRLAAEFDNFRKRVARERIELADRAQAGLAIRLLDVLDDLDRVVAGDTSGASNAIQQAIVLIDRKLRKELDSAGLERVDPVGLAFDPSFHEAVSVVPSPEASKNHTVSATFQAGYRFKGALIRPARVQVYSDSEQV
jgi:molecular chaperone GrpE